MDLLFSISRGEYPVNTLLPSLDKLSKEKHVSVSTVRRTLSLLNGVGATKSFKGVGTKVLPFHETAENCDFTSPMVKRRLLDMAQSLQILTLSSRAVSEITVSSLDAVSLQKCKEKLSMVRELGQWELVTFGTLELLQQFAPYEAIRTIYGELMQQLFWGYSLRSIWKKNEDKYNFYHSCLDDFINTLEQRDAVSFSEKLEQLMVEEFEFTITELIKLGIDEAKELLLTDIK